MTVAADVVATGFGFVEAPSFDRAGVLHFSEVRRGVVHRLAVARSAPAPTPAPSVFHHVESGWCNGTAFHADGRLFVCDVGAGCIWAIPSDGEAALFADRCTQDNTALRGPNDLVFDHEGSLYFTDPRGSSLEDPIGCVYRAAPDNRVERIADALAFPNGLALSADRAALIVAETRTRRLLRFPIGPNGAVGVPALFCQLPEDGTGPDGMAYAADGALFVCHMGLGCVDVVSPDGRLLDRIPAGGRDPSNCAFDGTALFVTVTDGGVGAIHRLDVGVPGQRLFGQS